MSGRLLVIAWKELLQLRRDRLTLAMTVVLPILQLLLFGFAVNTDVRHIRMVVFDQDRSPGSRDLARALAATGSFDLVGDVAGYAGVERALRGGSARRWSSRHTSLSTSRPDAPVTCSSCWTVLIRRWWVPRRARPAASSRREPQASPLHGRYVPASRCRGRPSTWRSTSFTTPSSARPSTSCLGWSG